MKSGVSQRGRTLRWTDRASTHRRGGAVAARFAKRLDVRLQREVVIDAAGHVAPVRGRQRAPRGLLEVHHLQRIFRAHRSPRVHSRPPAAAPRANRRREHGARGEELKEFAPARCMMLPPKCFGARLYGARAYVTKLSRFSCRGGNAKTGNGSRTNRPARR